MTVAYDKEMLYKKALEIVKSDNQIVFMYDIIVGLGISTSTFYAYFPDNSEQSNDLKQHLIDNRGFQKKKLRSKWYDSENATLNLCVYKLLADDDELKRLNDKEDSSTAAALSETIQSLVAGMKSDRDYYTKGDSQATDGTL